MPDGCALPRYGGLCVLRVRQVDKGTGADSERLKLKLTLEVESIEFDAEGERDTL